MPKFGLALGLGLVLAVSCGGSTGSDGKGVGGSGGSAGDAGKSCPSGQCLEDGGCVEATGPQGNALCVGANGVCSYCVCASPDTPIATPSGNRRIDELEVGDPVYSVDQGRVRVVPLLATHRTAVLRHHVVRVELETGSTLEISPGHPTADGRSFADLRAGDSLDGVGVKGAELVPYRHTFTYDILPASDTGTYFAAGVLIGSTLLPAGARDCAVTSPQSTPLNSAAF